MRKKIVAGNWKMNTTVPEGVELAKAVAAKSAQLPAGVELVVAPPFTHLALVAEALKGSKVELSAQNCADKDKGAFTGEISVDMLKSVNCSYTILGHSERRQYYGETDEKLVEKVKLAFAAGLKVILCVGENLEQREAGKEAEIVSKQIKADLLGLSGTDVSKLVIAYEPVWAIGTGKTASPAQAEEMCELIRKYIEELYDEDICDRVTIQYGGSVKPENATEIMNMDEIDGALVGGASLVPEKFMGIINF